MTSAHPEDACDQCGRPNIVWFTDNPLWNAAIPAEQRHLILCPVCFVRRFERAGAGKVAWELKVDPLTAHRLAANADGLTVTVG